MDLEGITVSEISQEKTNTRWFHLYVESKVTELMETKNRLPEAGVGREDKELLFHGYIFKI